MRCPKCVSENPDTAVFCNVCGSKFAAPDAAETPVPPEMGRLLPRLPHVLAVPLIEYARETVPYVKLHRMCDAAELLTRFAAAVLLADLLRKGKGRFPLDRGGTCPLEAALARHLAAPTFGSWRVILEEALRHYRGDKKGALCFVEDMPGFARKLVQELGGNADDPNEKLIPCRNLAAHSGRMPDGEAQALLEAHSERLEAMFEGCRFLGDYPLVARGTEPGLVRLMGTAIPASLMALPQAVADRAAQGRLYLVSRDGGDLLDLTPLHTFQAVRVRTESEFREAQEPPDPVPQVYFRAERDLAYLEYLTFATAAPHGQDAHGALERFKELFRLDEWRAEAERKAEAEAVHREYSFRRLRDGLLAGFVGRGECLDRMRDALRAKREGGIVWMTGKAGSGKSALVARFLEDGRLGIDQPDRCITVFHFFRAQEGTSCSRQAFLRNALSRLLSAAGLTEAIEEEPRKREEQFSRVLGEIARKEAELPWRPWSKEESASAKPPFRRGILFFLDGLDELLVSDPGFPDFVLQHRFGGVVWFCAGQPLEPLQKAFAPSERCLHVFPAKAVWDTPDEREGGVPRMTRNEVYEYLMTECPSAGYELMRRDATQPREDAEGGEQPIYPNPFVDTLIEKSQGLPLYLYLVARDVREGRVTFREGQEQTLPSGLREYYDRLLELMSIGDLRAVMTPIIMQLAAARAPLTAEALRLFLGHVAQLKGPRGRALLDRALAFGHTMLRRVVLPAWKEKGKPRLGFTLYHESFREHLLDPATRAVEVSREVAREAVENACVNWKAVEDNPDALEYCLRFGPAHLVESGRWGYLKSLLTDHEFLEAKCSAGMTYDLLRDFETALEGLPAKRPLRRIIGLLNEALRRDVHFIVRHPGALFQCLWNSCWWYDSPQAARHYVKPKGGWEEAPPWRRPGRKLYRLMESWRKAKRRANPGLVWLRSLRPPFTHLGTAQKAVFRGHEDRVEAVAYSPDGRRIASGSADKTVRVWDARSGKEVLCLRGHGRPVENVGFSPDGRWIISGSDVDSVKIWDAESGEELRRLRGQERRIWSVACSPDGRRIAAATGEGMVRVWDVGSAKGLGRRLGGGRPVHAVAWSPDGGRIAGGAMDASVRVWEAESGVELFCLSGNKRSVHSVAFGPDGRKIVSGGRGAEVRVWDAETGRESGRLRGHEDLVQSVGFSPDGRRIVSGSWDRTVRIWDAESGTELVCLQGHEDYVTSAAYSPDGRRIVSGSVDGTVRIWNVEGGEKLRNLREHEAHVLSVECSPDGSRVASGSLDGTVRVWDAERGTEGSWLRGHKDWVTCVAFSADGRRLVTGSADKTLRVWDLKSCKQLRRLSGNKNIVYGVACSPDGRWIAGAGRDQTVRVWDAKTGKQSGCLRGHRRVVYAVAFSPDSERIVSGSRDQTVRVWEFRTGKQLRSLRGHRSSIRKVVCSPDGRYIVSATSRSVLVWDAKTYKCVQGVKGRADASNIAAGPSQFPFRASLSELETIVEESATGTSVAWFPVVLNHLTTHSSGRIWAGAGGNHLHIIKLERFGGRP